jgi:4-hydroxy-tetrahydrodipicolinate synthase
MSPLGGVIAAVPTPLGQGRVPDTDRFVAHARWALENGCDGLNVLGSTGEATSLSFAARGAVMRAAADHLPTDRLMVGTGAPDLETATALTRLAGELGFAGALVLPPYYYTAVTEDGLFDFFDAVIRETETTGVPVYLYNFPQMTGLKLTGALAGRLKAAHPDRLRGAKDSSGEAAQSAALAEIADFDVFPSDEAVLATARAAGFAGTVSATVNLSAPLAQAVWQAQVTGPDSERLGAIRRAVSAQPLVPAVKHLAGRRMGDPAWDAVLPPLRALDPAQKAALDPIWTEIAAL